MGHYNRIYHFITIGIILVSVVSPISEIANADEITTIEIEARAVNVSFSMEEEVIIQWENIHTNDATLIDDLKDSKYSIYRSQESFSTVDLEVIEPLVSGIRACEINETNANCSGKLHTYIWNPPAETNGDYFYGVSTQVHSNGNYSTIFNYQNSSISEPISEFVKPHWGPLELQANFIQSKSATELNWINPAEFDASIPTNHTTWIWRHSELATRSNWDQLNKEIIASFLSSSTTSYEVQHNSPIEKYNYYTITYSFDEMSYIDERFLGTNTLLEPILEDNVAPTLVGQLSASYSNGITHLSWEAAVMETNLITRIWRSSEIIQYLDDSDVQSIGFVSGQISNWNFQNSIEEHGEFWYAVTLEDELGNSITEIEPIHPMTGPIFEHSLTGNFVPSNIQATTLPGGFTEISWNAVPTVRDASYHLWRSFSQEITSISDLDVEYIDSINGEELNYIIQSDIGVERYVWYAVTIEAKWGTSSKLYNETMIQKGNNSIITGVYEDLLTPPQVEDLNASYNQESGGVSISWTPSVGAISHSIWMLDSNIGVGPKWNITYENWTLLATIYSNESESPTFEHTPPVFGQYILYAITAADEIGNEQLMLNGSGPVEVILITNTTNETRSCLGCCGNTYEIPITQECNVVDCEPCEQNSNTSENDNASKNSTVKESTKSSNSLDNLLIVTMFLLVLYILINMARRKNNPVSVITSSEDR